MSIGKTIYLVDFNSMHILIQGTNNRLSARLIWTQLSRIEDIPISIPLLIYSIYRITDVIMGVHLRCWPDGIL